MEYLYYAAAFILGAIIMFLIARQRIRILLAGELKAYRREIKKNYKWWKPELFPLLPVLKRHKDHYKKEAEELQKILIDESLRTEQQIQKITKLAGEMDELRRENRELKAIVSSPSSVKSSSPPSIAGDHNIRHSYEMQKEEMVTLFFGIPDTEGRFPSDRGETQYDSRKLFKVVAKVKSEMGELHYLSGELDMKAINNIDYYLVPVCEISNISGRNSAVRVVQEEKGAVSLVSGKWICTTKIKIKLV